MRRFLLLSTGLLLLVAAAHAQTATLVGTVTDDEGEPLVGAHVFIAVSMIGTTTDTEGGYRLTGVPLGAHRLYVSSLGFEPAGQDLLLREARVYTHDFVLQVDVIELEEGVVVEAEGDPNWKRRLEKFTRLFIGETPNAQETTILNPEVLSFSERGGKFTAYTDDALLIENRALGYRVQYFLNDFVNERTRVRYDGEPLFEEMEPESDAQAAAWAANRRQAFIGSFRHFMLALLAGKTEEQGFTTYARQQDGMSPAGPQMSQNRYPIDANELLQPGEVAREKTLHFEGFVEVIFRGEKEDPAYLEWQQQSRRRPKFQTSWLTMERGPTTVDYKGDILDPYAVTLMGYLAFERIADDVPKEYRPGR